MRCRLAAGLAGIVLGLLPVWPADADPEPAASGATLAMPVRPPALASPTPAVSGPAPTSTSTPTPAPAPAPAADAPPPAAAEPVLPPAASAPALADGSEAHPAPVLTTLDDARRAYLEARLLLQEQKHAEARRLLDAVLALAPTWSLPKLALARSLREQGSEQQRREELLQEAAAVDPENHQVLYELGLLHEEAGRRADAITCYRKAVERRPDLIHAQERLGVLLAEAGELDEARGHLEVVAADQRGNLVAVSLLATVLEGLHRYEEARERLEQLVALAPEQALYLTRLAAFYQRQGDTAAMNATLGKARRLLERQQPARPKMRPLSSPPPKRKRAR